MVTEATANIASVFPMVCISGRTGAANPVAMRAAREASSADLAGILQALGTAQQHARELRERVPLVNEPARKHGDDLIDFVRMVYHSAGELPGTPTGWAYFAIGDYMELPTDPGKSRAWSARVKAWAKRLERVRQEHITAGACGRHVA